MTVEVECTLEEFYYGCQKTIEFEKTTLMDDGSTPATAKVTKIIQVKPGAYSGHELVFPAEGHQLPGSRPANLIIKFKQAAHKVFKRIGHDLVLEHKISLIDALSAGPIHFKTIEHEQVEISVDQVISPESFKVIPGKGMPVLNDDPLGPIKKDYGRGNLILKFDIQFPASLNEDKKQQLIGVLDDIEDEHMEEMAF